jgi:hypothetical protein
MAITRDKLLVVTRNLATALQSLMNQHDLPDSAPCVVNAQRALDEAEDLIGEEVTEERR